MLTKWSSFLAQLYLVINNCICKFRGVSSLAEFFKSIYSKPQIACDPTDNKPSLLSKEILVTHKIIKIFIYKENIL